jgi:hypothetical protein
MRLWTGCLLFIALCFPIVVAQAGRSPTPRDSCAKPKVWLSSEELGNRITHREPLQLHGTVTIAPDAVLSFKLVITPEGAVECMSLQQGHPILAAWAIESVKGWRFSPLVVRGKHVSYGAFLILQGKDFE